MRPSGDGVWSVSAALPPGTHHFRFLVDGAWCNDPEYPLRVANPFGGQNMVRVVPQAQPKPARAAAIPSHCLTERQPEWKLQKAVREVPLKPRMRAL